MIYDFEKDKYYLESYCDGVLYRTEITKEQYETFAAKAREQKRQAGEMTKEELINGIIEKMTRLGIVNFDEPPKEAEKKRQQE